MLSVCRSNLRASTSRLCPSQSRNYATSLRKSVKNEALTQDLSNAADLFKTYKPVTPSIRHLIRPKNDHLWAGYPFRPLTIAKRKHGGRNHSGKITTRHRGGGHKRRIRILDFMRSEPGVHDVVRIEYDPNRSAHIALLKNRNPVNDKAQIWSYIIATEHMRAGDEVQSFRGGIPEGFIPGFDNEHSVEATAEEATSSTNTSDGEIPVTDLPNEVDTAEPQQPTTASDESLAVGLLRTLTLKPGNALPLSLMPIGTVVHCISLSPQGPGVLVRSAGSSAMIMGHDVDGRYSHVRLQSGEVRKVLSACVGTVGKVSNPLWKNRSLGKAGRRRNLGWRPSVRGVAMNKKDHPHGGGRGKSKSNKQPVSPWGWQTKGLRTRKPGYKGPKGSNKLVIKERPRGKEKRAN